MSSAKILIVEDDYKSFKLCRDLLEVRGHQVMNAATGKEALAMIESEKPDLVLLDIILPDTNGLVILKLIKENPEIKEIPIIAVTSLAMEAERMECLEAGCVDHIPKPIDTTGFVDKIERFLPR